MSQITVFESPNSYQKKSAFFEEGSSPAILNELLSFLEENKNQISELYLVWYLFNNKILHDKLVALAESFDKIEVITIPLEGFDDRYPNDVINRQTNEVVYKEMTKRKLGVPIFKDHYKKLVPENYKLYVFPHIYIRSAYVNPFSRGQMPYSLHAKCGYIKFKNGSSKAIISSSNLAVRDKVKEENLSIVDIDNNTALGFKKFIDDLLNESIILSEFEKDLNVRTTRFQWLDSVENDNISIIAPFYFNSGFKTEEFLIKKIRNAKNRIYIMGQHLASVNYKIPKQFHSKINEIGETRESILKIIADKNEEVEIKYASQTYVQSDHDKRSLKGFRKPANITNFKALSNYIHDKPNISYFVNSNIHSKFLIIDDEVIITTFNFTPTPFIFLDQVTIEKFVKMPKQPKYDGVYSEVGLAICSKDSELLKCYLDYFNGVSLREETTKTYPIE